tara:strand:+ start:3179 stop:4357 length:1179 start_codon:yes stop_codon:yes gene_type:complete
MPIIAYASGAQNLPNEDPPSSFTEASDPVITLANQNLPLDVNLYGNAVDTNDVSPTFVYQWSILSQTHQNPQLTLSGGGTIQNPVLEQVNTWGNIRCFLVVTNQNSGETSETDPLRAPSSAFVTVRLKSPNATIQKIASGERNWHNDADDWATAIENIAAGDNGLPPHTITEHTDVVDATGADLEALSSGGYANDPDNAANPLHIHHGDHVDAATRGTRGTVTIESAAGPARAINIERIVLTANVNWTYLDNGQLVPFIAPMTVEDEPNVAHSPNLATWFIKGENLRIRQFTVAMADGGTSQPQNQGNPYVFDLTVGTEQNFQNNVMNRLNIDLSGAPAVDNGPMIVTNNNLDINLGDKLLGLVVPNGPGKLVSDSLGRNLTATIVLVREAT